MKQSSPTPSYRTLVPTVAVMTLVLSACNPLASKAEPSSLPSSSPVAETIPLNVPTDAIASPAVLGESIMDTAEGTLFDQTVFYNNPAGGDEVRFMVKVNEAGEITAADTEVKAVNQVSQGLQTKFKAELPQAVVGKKLSELQIDRIGGASLTTGAFKKFLSEIKT